MPRGRALQRTLKLLDLIARPSGATIGEAAREMGCTVRTIYRDLQVLQGTGYPLYSTPDGEGVLWKLVDGFRWRHQIPFTHEELCALWLGRDALAAIEGTAFAEGARSALEKVRATLAAPVRERLDRARETMSVAGPGRSYGDRADALRRAAEERRTVEVLYESLSGARRRRRLIDPYLMWFDAPSGALYFAGWAHDRREVRTFLVDRARQVFPTDRAFTPLPGWDARSYLTESFAAFRGRPASVRLLFTGRAARLIAERTWHPSQSLRPRPGRAVELTMRVPLSPALTGFVLSWLPEVRVLVPGVLARWVAEAARAAVAPARSEGKSRGALRRNPKDVEAA
jgi:proteasome accessory factor B